MAEDIRVRRSELAASILTLPGDPTLQLVTGSRMLRQLSGAHKGEFDLLLDEVARQATENLVMDRSAYEDGYWSYAEEKAGE